MVTVLSDYNCIGHAQRLFLILEEPDYVEMLEIKLAVFADVGLPINADDETVWQFCQDNGYFLLTANRSGADGDISLEAVIRRHYSEQMLPVLTITDPDRVMNDRAYRERCAVKLLETVIDTIEEKKYLGVPRVYLSS